MKRKDSLPNKIANERAKFLQEKKMNTERNKDPREMMTVIQKTFREQYDGNSHGFLISNRLLMISDQSEITNSGQTICKYRWTVRRLQKAL